MTTTALSGARPATAAEPAPPQCVLPNVWRWADPAGSDRCGTALVTPDGLVLIDPPALPEAIQALLAGGSHCHVVLTSAALAGLAAPALAALQEAPTIWAPHPAAPGPARPAARLGAGAALRIDTFFAPGDSLPGGLVVCPLPPAAGDEVALLWPAAGRLLVTGDVLPVIGQTPVYYEGVAPPFEIYLEAIKTLLAAEPGALAPSRQAPPDPQVMRATAYAAYLGTRAHERRAAPVSGPRYLVPRAQRVLLETLEAPVVMRRPTPFAPPEIDHDRWLADPFACARCGRPNLPLRETCGGPPIPRLCPACRQQRREILPAARVMVCAGGCCTRTGARAVLSALRQATAAQHLAESVDVVPVSCLGECSLGPFVRVSTAEGIEPPFARRFRQQATERARQYAAEEDEIIDHESELVLSRFAALVRPAEAERLVELLRDALSPTAQRPPGPPAPAEPGEPAAGS